MNTQLKAGDDVVLNEGQQQGYIQFVCGTESFMVRLADGSNVGPIHASALRLKPKQEPPTPAPRVIVLDDE